MKARALVTLLRPVNALMSAAAVFVAAYVAAGTGAPWSPVAAAALAAAAIAAAGNAANDAADAAIDRVAHPTRPIPRGDATARQAYGYAIILAAAGVAAAAFAGTGPLILAMAAVLLLAAYEWRLKESGLPGNVAVALLTGATFLMGGLAAGSVGGVILLFAALAALANLGRELAKDLEDAEADEGRRTLPRRGHAGLARGMAAGALLAGVAFSPFPYIVSENDLAWTFVPLVSLADFGFLAAAWNLRRPRLASRWAKAAMVLAMVAFFVGRLTTDVIA